MNLQLPVLIPLPEAEALIVILAIGLATAIAVIFFLIWLLNGRLARIERAVGFGVVERAAWPGSEHDPIGEVETWRFAPHEIVNPAAIREEFRRRCTPRPLAWWRR